MTTREFKSAIKEMRNALGENPLHIIGIESINEVEEFEYGYIIQEIDNTYEAHRIKRLQETEQKRLNEEAAYQKRLKDAEEKAQLEKDKQAVYYSFDDVDFEETRETKMLFEDIEEEMREKEKLDLEEWQRAWDEAEFNRIESERIEWERMKAKYDEYNIGFLNEINILREKQGHEAIFYEDIFHSSGEPRWYPLDRHLFEVMIYDAAVREIFDAVERYKIWDAKDPASITFGYSYVNAPKLKGGNYIRSKTNLNRSREWKKGRYEFMPEDELAAMSYKEFKKLKGLM